MTHQLNLRCRRQLTPPGARLRWRSPCRAEPQAAPSARLFCFPSL